LQIPETNWRCIQKMDSREEGETHPNKDCGWGTKKMEQKIDAKKKGPFKKEGATRRTRFTAARQKNWGGGKDVCISD